MHRRVFSALALSAALVASLPAMGQDRLKAVTTFTIIADMARNVAGDAADVVSITKPGAEIHNYQPTPEIWWRRRTPTSSFGTGSISSSGSRSSSTTCPTCRARC